MNEVFVGIDVSKSRLDVAIRPTGEVLSVDNSADGISELLRVLKEQPPALVVLEATGVADREHPCKSVRESVTVRHFEEVRSNRRSFALSACARSRRPGPFPCPHCAKFVPLSAHLRFRNTITLNSGILCPTLTDSDENHLTK